MNQIVNSRPAVNKTYVELTDDAKKIYEMAQIMEDEGTKTLEQSMQEYIVLGGVLQKMKVHKDNRRKWDSSLTTIGLTSKFANKIISLYEYKDLEGMGTITTRQQGLDLIAVHTGKSSEPTKSEERSESDESEKIEEVQHEDEKGSEEHIPSEKAKPAKVKGSHGPRRPRAEKRDLEPIEVFELSWKTTKRLDRQINGDENAKANQWLDELETKGFWRVKKSPQS